MNAKRTHQNSKIEGSPSSHQLLEPKRQRHWSRPTNFTFCKVLQNAVTCEVCSYFSESVVFFRRRFFCHFCCRFSMLQFCVMNLMYLKDFRTTHIYKFKSPTGEHREPSWAPKWKPTCGPFLAWDEQGGFGRREVKNDHFGIWDYRKAANTSTKEEIHPQAKAHMRRQALKVHPSKQKVQWYFRSICDGQLAWIRHGFSEDDTIRFHSWMRETSGANA